MFFAVKFLIRPFNPRLVTLNLNLNLNTPPHSMEPMRHVLIVCYDFPRLDAAGVIRVYQLMKGLIACGWQSVMMTAHPCNTGAVQDIEASDGELPCPKFTVARLKLPRRGVNDRCTDAPDDENGLPSVKYLARYARQLAVPDGKVGWILPAVASPGF